MLTQDIRPELASADCCSSRSRPPSQQCRDRRIRPPSSAAFHGPERLQGSSPPARHRQGIAPRSYSRSCNPGKDKRMSGGSVPSSGKSSSSAHLIAASPGSCASGQIAPRQPHAIQSDAHSLLWVASRRPLLHLFCQRRTGPLGSPCGVRIRNLYLVNSLLFVVSNSCSALAAL